MCEVEPSANKIVLRLVDILVRSFIYRRNNTGPKTLPCGTSKLTVKGLEG